MIIDIKTFKDTINAQNMVICLYLSQKILPAPLPPAPLPPFTSKFSIKLNLVRVSIQDQEFAQF